jgi:hypothetical protein
MKGVATTAESRDTTILSKVSVTKNFSAYRLLYTPPTSTFQILTTQVIYVVLTILKTNGGYLTKQH